MKRALKIALGSLLLMTLWLGFVFWSGVRGLWLDPVAEAGDRLAFVEWAEQRLQSESAGNSAFLLIERGDIVAEYYSASVDAIDGETVFQVASMSKWIAAAAVMTLIEHGRLSLDAPISDYLSRWQLPESGFDNSQVTVRLLLSHTAGLTDGLGFGDYAQNERIPDLEQSLVAPRASSDREVEIAVQAEPGTAWNYSGGGYLILELLVEEITGMSFADYVRMAIFDPLNMQRSGYGYLSDIDNNAGSYDMQGNSAEVYQYASNAATGLVTSAYDLAAFLRALMPDANAASLLSAESVRQMHQPHGRTQGIDIWGLGSMLYAPSQQGDFIFGHDGGNEPAINSTARINPDNGDAIVVLVTGHPSVATAIGSQWVFWQSGYPDFLESEAVIASMLFPGLLGVLLIAVLALILWIRGLRVRP